MQSSIHVNAFTSNKINEFDKIKFGNNPCALPDMFLLFSNKARVII